MSRLEKSFRIFLLLVLLIGTHACSKSEEAPAAPAMPESWKVKLDESVKPKELAFLEVEGRLQGKVKALRVTVYEVNGHPVKLHTIVPNDSEEGDKMYRILAHKKQPWSYLRKDEVLYEFAGSEESEKDIVAAREWLLR